MNLAKKLVGRSFKILERRVLSSKSKSILNPKPKAGMSADRIKSLIDMNQRDISSDGIISNQTIIGFAYGNTFPAKRPIEFSRTDGRLNRGQLEYGKIRL
jgi:hypothetical protein